MSTIVRDARPVLLVRDIAATLAYYRDRLGFDTASFGEPANFGSASRGGATLLFALHADAGQIVPNWQLSPGTWNAYIEVEGVNELHAEFRERGAHIDYGPYDAPHGFRELGIQDPNGYDIAFGEPLA